MCKKLPELFHGAGVYRSGVALHLLNAGKNAAGCNVSVSGEFTENGIEARLAKCR
jgi:hypothetical protein